MSAQLTGTERRSLEAFAELAAPWGYWTGPYMEHQHYEEALNAGGAHHHLYSDITSWSDVFFRNLAKVALGETVLQYDLCDSLVGRMNQVDWVQNKQGTQQFLAQFFDENRRLARRIRCVRLAGHGRDYSVIMAAGKLLLAYALGNMDECVRLRAYIDEACQR